MLPFLISISSNSQTQDVTSSVANYRYDAVCAFVEDSDLLDDFYQVWEMYLYKNNIKGTVFTDQANINQSMSLASESGGRLRHELYFRGDLDNTVTGLNSQRTWFNGVFGRNPSALAYALGIVSNSNAYKDLVIAGRNSDAVLDRLSNGDTFFGSGLGIPDTPVSSDWISRASTTRVWETSGTEQQAFDYCTAQLALSKANNGWHNNFMHARDPHTAVDLGFTDRYLSEINSEIGSDFVWRTSYGEAVEYAYFRHIITGVTATYSNNAINITVTKNSYVNHDLISVPISVKIDITGTPLAGMELTTNSVGIRKVSANEFVVDIAKGNDGENITATLTETQTPSYYDFTLPSITSATVNGSTLTVVTDRPTKIATWITDRGSLEETSLLHKRSSTFQTSHDITLDAGDTAKDIYISVLSETEQSILSPVYQFA